MKPLAAPLFVAALTALSAALLLAATQPIDMPAPTRMPEYARARETADTLITDTRALLMREIAAHGTARALGACATSALEVAARLEPEGWRVRRVSKLWRNPADAPDAYEAKVLDRFEGMRKRGTLTAQTEHAEVVVMAGRPTLRYLRPVTIPGEFCLQCHGSLTAMAKDVRVALRATYPKDRAYGYRVGDLRGAISIAVPVEHPQE